MASQSSSAGRKLEAMAANNFDIASSMSLLVATKEDDNVVITFSKSLEEVTSPMKEVSDVDASIAIRCICWMTENGSSINDELHDEKQ